MGGKEPVPGKLLTEELTLNIRFLFKTKRKRDLDNQNKLVLDALNGIICEGSQIAKLRLSRDNDTQNPHIEVSIEPLGTDG